MASKLDIVFKLRRVGGSLGSILRQVQSIIEVATRGYHVGSWGHKGFHLKCPSKASKNFVPAFLPAEEAPGLLSGLD